MGQRIEDYAVIGNCETMALVGRDGSIDWACLPRFDSAACFAALLGDEQNGRWKIGATGESVSISRRYREGTLILETTFETPDGAAVLIDAMTRREGSGSFLREVRGLRGKVAMHMDLVVRFDYGAAVPWVSRLEDGRLQLVAGPDRLLLKADAEFSNHNMRTQANFDVKAGETRHFHLAWSKSYLEAPPMENVGDAVAQDEQDWLVWGRRVQGAGEWTDIVRRSLITLKALTHFATGGIVAAATTSLPERIGGPRNWDYRYCWLRDATLTLFALLESGYIDEARAWQQWLVRAVAGSPAQLQIMYGVAGERRLDEFVVPWLPGYENSAPVRVGNAASGQVQLDVYGEVLGALYYGRTKGLHPDATVWALECALVEHLQTIWDQPDDGIWEIRGERQHFTHSKVMAWVAVDRAIRSAEEFGLQAPLPAWRAWRRAIHDDVCEKAFDKNLNSFVQAYGGQNLDASLLMIALVGFLPIADARVRGTIAAVESRLLRDGLVMRYDTGSAVDGLPEGEGAFLACSFWLADNYVLQGRMAEARALFEKLTCLTNDVGLLAEEYEPRAKRQVGNFPQAFSHIALINTAYNLSRKAGPAAQRSGQAEAPKLAHAK